MGYCLACGMLRETDGGVCGQCAKDDALHKSADAKSQAAKIKARVRNGKMCVTIPDGLVSGVARAKLRDA